MPRGIRRQPAQGVIPAAPIVEDDEVNYPAHYTQGGIECVDAIEAALTREEFVGWLRGEIFRYTWRTNLKDDPATNARKAGWYNDRLVRKLSED